MKNVFLWKAYVNVRSKAEKPWTALPDCIIVGNGFTIIAIDERIAFDE